MIPDPYTPADLLPGALAGAFIFAMIIVGTWISEWPDDGRPSPLLARLDPIRARFNAWFDRVVPVEEYPGQYDAALAPELIAKRDRTYAEADALWGDEAAQVDAEWARIEAVIDAEDIAAWEREMGEVA